VSAQPRAGSIGNDIVQSVFLCSLCGEIAATVTLIPKNAQHPDVLNSVAATLVLSDFIGKTQEQVGGAQEAPLRAALVEKDARKLYELEHLWAPFYCHQCQRSYCIKHWVVLPRYDDEFPGFYDCSIGTCPEGHRRKIDD
jgi:hypothetical protein